MSVAKWLRRPSRTAVLLGLGALSAAGTQPAMAQPELGKGPLRVPQQSAKSFGEVLIWSDGGRIYFSESGKEAQELRLGDTPQARQLRELLQREGAVADAPRVLQHRLILVGGGGSAIHWGGAPSSKTPDDPGRASTARGSHPPTKPAPGKSAGQGRNPDGTKIAGSQKQN